MKVILDILLVIAIVWGILWTQQNQQYVIVNGVTIGKVQKYVVDRGSLLWSKIGNDIHEINWSFE